MSDDRSQWLELRRQHIGASDMPAIMGRSPWATPADIWAQKVHGGWRPETPAMQVGHVVEPGLVAWMAKLLQKPVLTEQFRISAADEIFSATHDGLVEDEPTGIEAKVSTDPRWGESGTDGVPDHVLIQCQHQMLVSDLQEVYVPVLLVNFRMETRWFRVERDPTIIESILEVGQQFWRDYVVPQVPPPGEWGDTAAKLVPLKKGTVLEIGPDNPARPIVERFRDLRAAEKAAKAEAKTVVGQLARVSCGAGTLHCPGAGKLVWVTTKRRSVSPNELRERFPEVYEQVVHEFGSRYLRWYPEQPEGHLLEEDCEHDETDEQ
jgi:putative phage-type endonuclease